MVKRLFASFAGLFLLIAVAVAQEVPDGIVGAFKRGNAQDLAYFFGNKINLVIQNRSADVDRMAAEKTLALFFSANKVSKFTVNHTGKRDDSGYLIATMNTTGGTYRVNCFCRKVQNKYIIHQIRIDKTNE